MPPNDRGPQPAHVSCPKHEVVAGVAQQSGVHGNEPHGGKHWREHIEPQGNVTKVARAVSCLHV